MESGLNYGGKGARVVGIGAATGAAVISTGGTILAVGAPGSAVTSTTVLTVAGGGAVIAYEIDVGQAAIRSEIAGHQVDSLGGGAIHDDLGRDTKAGQIGSLVYDNLNLVGILLGRGMRGESVAPTKTNPLKAGVDFEAQQLTELGLSKNDTIWRPSVQRTESSAFKVIVGDPKYTRGGLLRRTKLDATEAGLLKIKHGSSTLDSTYQLRLQTFRSVAGGGEIGGVRLLSGSTPYTIRTTRPINPTFQDWLQRRGVNIEGIK